MPSSVELSLLPSCGPAPVLHPGNSSSLRAGVAFQALLTALAGSPEHWGSEPINAVELQNGFSGNNNKQRL